MGNRASVHLVLDHGGPINIWREEAPGSSRRRLLITTRICDNPGCDCRDILVEGIVFDDRYENIEFGSRALRYSFKPRPGEPSEEPPLRRLSAAVDVDSGEVSFNASAPAERHDQELLGWLKVGMDDFELERLRRRWRLAKNIDQDRWRLRDWSWWRPGDMVSWPEVFPDEMNIMFLLKDEVYWADDMYCINPGCKCKEAGLSFHRISTSETEPEHLGAIAVTLPSGRFSGLLSDQADGPILKPLWDELRKRPGQLALFKDRMKRIKPVGQEIVRLSVGGHDPLRPLLPKKGDSRKRGV